WGMETILLVLACRRFWSRCVPCGAFHCSTARQQSAAGRLRQLPTPGGRARGDHAGNEREPRTMIEWKRTLREGLLSGTLAGLFSAAVLMVTGKRETGSAVAPVNAESHWLWGDESLREDRPTLRHTFTGIVTHQLST